MRQTREFMSRTLAVAGLAAVLMGLPACGKGPAPEVDPMEPAYVQVENQSFYDMTIYAWRSGMRMRLGIVSGNSTAMFPIPRSMANPGMPIRFQADPIGSSRTPFSQEISVSPGETLVLQIPPT